MLFGVALNAFDPDGRSTARSAATTAATARAAPAIRRRRPSGFVSRRSRARRRLKRRVVLEDLPLQGLQLGARLDPELVHEPAPRRAVGLERLGLTSAAVERDEQLALEPLPERVRGDQRLELGQDVLMAAEREVGLDPILERRQPQVLEPPDLVLRERLVREVGERRSAPEPERLAEAVGGRGGLFVARLLDERLEAGRVERVVLELKRVAGCMCRERAVAEGPAQACDVALDVLRGSLRRALAPELVDERVNRDDVASTEQQKCQKRAWLAGRKVEGAPFPRDFKRPEDAEFERFAHTTNRRSTGVNRSSTARGESRRHRNRKEPSCSARSHEPRVSPR